jgi:hypothetical protein
MDEGGGIKDTSNYGKIIIHSVTSTYAVHIHHRLSARVTSLMVHL